MCVGGGGCGCMSVGVDVGASMGGDRLHHISISPGYIVLLI